MRTRADPPRRRETWKKALVLDPHSELQASLIGELAEYLGASEKVVLERCRAGAVEVAEAWRAAAPRSAAEVSDFYRNSDVYLYDLTWWHALSEDESALSQVQALELAAGYRARTVLDFGSGIGSLGLLFAQNGLDVTLAEINTSLNDYARRRFDRRGLSARFLDVGSDALPEAAFDFVSAIDVLEHVPDPRSTLVALAAALRPGGTLFIRLPPDADSSRPMHLWHGPDTVLRHLGETGLWPARIEDSVLVLRRGPAPRYEITPSVNVRQTNEGWVLLSERPLMATRLNPRAAGLLTRLEGGRSATELSEESGVPLSDVVSFLDGLTRRRILNRTARTSPVRWPAATVVVPARNRPSETRACVESLLALDYPSHLLEIIVVDDASAPPLSKALSDLPVRLLRRDKGAGQSAARNLASDKARGEVLAFTDNDCVAEAGWLRSLVACLCEPGTDLAGGRVLSPPPEGPVAAFEATRSPLDMGAAAGAVGPKEPVAYLPSCNLAADKETLRWLGGFDQEMTLGEDADLVWRALRAGRGVRYEPSAEIVHRHRTRLAALLDRRADYGSSEADLQLRHPDTRRVMTVPVVGTAALAALTMLPVAWPVGLGLATLAGSALGVELRGKMRRLRKTGLRLPPRKVSAAVMRQHGAGLYHLGANVVRYYSLPLLAASLMWLPLLPPVLLLVLIPPLVDHRRLRPETSPISFALLYWSEMAAYQIGVWRGCLKRRTLRPLIPVLKPSIPRLRS
ncbi:MAG TPA: mycofactocin biosynthesis glycosyltransferase MftF [Rubrobacteraceae bacterium]|nr:mycofactocin biosynthesis glycosyltransferase MftF [Rubrobacteraceae bacterium]